MKYIIKYTLLLLAFVSVATIDAQDTIKKKNGEILKVVVKEINDTQIKYHHFDDPNQVLFTFDRMMVTDIKFSYGKEYKEEEPIMTDDYFIGDQNMAFKLSMSGLWWNSAILSFDKAINPTSGYQVSAKLFGIGIGSRANSDNEVSGFGLELGYKLKFGGLKKETSEYRPDHLLSGGYIMPTIGFNSINRYNNYSKNESDVFYFGLNFGKQKVIQHAMAIDYYGGFAFYGGSQTSTNNGYSDEIYESSVSAGDLFGINNVAFTLGLKVGFVFGEYGAQKDKLKRRK